ncbi:hypothetical protein B0H12DRAFT_1055072 [Mycena haematopus]|nr:hypothetical protein B0H12DRAFT_1055072 [Mycena haematopus]
MDDLPVEIHLKIYSIACRDDGSTGSALSLVSKHVRELSAEHRYQSIAVCGPIQIQHLVDHLRSVPPELRRIRFLFIYDYVSLSRHGTPRNRVTARDGAHNGVPAQSQRSRLARPFHTVEPPLTGVESLIHHMLMTTDLFESDWERFLYRSATNVGLNIVEILSLAHETVEMLSLVCFDGKVSGNAPLQLLQERFPALTHLTVRGPHTLPNDPAFAPLVRTLDVSETALVQGFPSMLAANHPSILRLRVSRLTDMGRHAREIVALVCALRISPIPPTAFKPDDRPSQMSPGVDRLLVLEPIHYARSLLNRPDMGIRPILEKMHSTRRGFRLLPSQSDQKMGQQARSALEDWTSCAQGLPVKWGDAADKHQWNVDFFTV